MMKKIVVLALTACISWGCSQNNFSTSDQTETAVQSSPQKINIITTFYPPYEIAQKVGDDKVDVKNLTPPGAEPHDFEPTPKAIASLYNADIIIYNGNGFEPWLEKTLPELDKRGVAVLNLSEAYQNSAIKINPEEGVVKNEDEDHNSSYDPHFWLDPYLYLSTIETVRDELIAKDPENKTLYNENAMKYAKQIASLAQKYRDGLKNCTHRTIVTSHNAFAYLGREFDLEILPVAGISPEAEPAPQTLAKLADLVKKEGIDYIFTETLVSPKIAETLANETGVQTLTLNPLEGLTTEEIKRGENYISVMEENLQNLQLALQCR